VCVHLLALFFTMTDVLPTSRFALKTVLYFGLLQSMFVSIHGVCRFLHIVCNNEKSFYLKVGHHEAARPGTLFDCDAYSIHPNVFQSSRVVVVNVSARDCDC
jgi:hypothetical protein